MKTREELIDTIKKLIRNNKTGKAIELLEKEHLPELEINLINISSRHSKLTKDISLDIIDGESAQRSLNKINLELLELLKVINQETAEKEQKKEVVPKAKKNISKTIPDEKPKQYIENKTSAKGNSKLLIGAGILLLAIGAIWYFMQLNKKADNNAKVENRRKLEIAAAKKTKDSLAIVENEKLEQRKKDIFLGNEFEGGIIFYIDESGTKGLIAAYGDLTKNKIPWMAEGKDFVKAEAFRKGLFAGKSNTEKLVQKHGDGNYPAKLCYDYEFEGFDDWYLPSEEELNKLYEYFRKEDSKLSDFSNKYYWSSTEYNDQDVHYRSFHNGKPYYLIKGNQGKVRPIRQFN